MRMRKHLTLIYIKLSTLTLRNSGNCCLHFSRNDPMPSPFLHWTLVLGHEHRERRWILLAITLLRCPLPSQYEYTTSISSFLSSSCFFNHSCRRSSRILRSISSLSRSGRKEVSTAGFLPSFARFADGALMSSQPSMHNKSQV